jgi:hypothetical protein
VEVVSETLRRFCGGTGSAEKVDRAMLGMLGEPTDVRKWLAASLDKTIRLQLDPPTAMREMSSLAGPHWIRERRSQR